MNTGTLSSTAIRIKGKEHVRLRNFVDSKKRYYISKRAFDIAFSLLVSILILSWLIPVISILIMIETRGPVFFIQRRVGRGGKIFKCIKFRSMVLNSDANKLQARSNDCRITTIGRFLRNSNLDEFPQFLNVLKGDMSIVGPRPHMLQDCIDFSEVVEGYKFRNMVKPGITGLAQIKGYRGPALDSTTIFRRFQFDSFYIRNTNFMMDLRIIRETFLQTRQVLVNKLVGISTIESTPNVVPSFQTITEPVRN